jgi:hypothetical protein
VEVKRGVAGLVVGVLVDVCTMYIGGGGGGGLRRRRFMWEVYVVVVVVFAVVVFAGACRFRSCLDRTYSRFTS